jgi:hypothetical protein
LAHPDLDLQDLDQKKEGLLDHQDLDHQDLDLQDLDLKEEFLMKKHLHSLMKIKVGQVLGEQMVLIETK